MRPIESTVLHWRNGGGYVMLYLETLWVEASQAHTPWLLLLALVAFLCAKWVAVDQPRFKVMFFFLVTHLMGVLLSSSLLAAQISLGEMLRTPTWILGAAGMVGAGATLLFSVILPRMRLHTPLIVQDVVVGLGMVAAALGVLSRTGVNLSGLIATSAVFTAILGFSLQDVIGNIAGGLALQVDNSVEEGDWIRVNEVSGRVVEVRWRYTAVETRNWETVLIPNTVMTKSNVFILGKRRGQPTQWRRWVYFNVDWRFQPGDVINEVQTAVRGAQIDGVSDDPAPTVALVDMVDTFGKYAVRYWLTDLVNDDATDSAVRACIYFALQRSNMTLAMPAHALFVTEDTVDRKVRKSEKQLRRRRDLLSTLELFQALSEDERTELAQSMRYAPFAKGEVMTKQGADAHWLYLLAEGRAVVQVSDGSHERVVAQLTGPCFFGEMSLLTGEPRSATVVAETEVECFRLDRSAVQAVLDHRPQVAEQLAKLLAERQVTLQAALEGLTADAARERADKEATALLSRIRDFFSLN